jgi:hypothetical protein
MFDIQLTDEAPPELDGGVSALYGSIEIGDFKEKFVVSLVEWTPERYERQWREAAKRLLEGFAKSAFVTSFVSPRGSFYFVWWVCFRIRETVHIQNQLRFYEQLPGPFSVDALYDYILIVRS